MNTVVIAHPATLRRTKYEPALLHNFQPLKLKIRTKGQPKIKDSTRFGHTTLRWPTSSASVNQSISCLNNLLETGDVYLKFPDSGHLLDKGLHLLRFSVCLLVLDNTQHRQLLVMGSDPVIYLCGIPSDYETELLLRVINLPTAHGGDGKCRFLISMRDVLLHDSLDSIEGHPFLCFEPRKLRQLCVQASERGIRGQNAVLHRDIIRPGGLLSVGEKLGEVRLSFLIGQEVHVILNGVPIWSFWHLVGQMQIRE